MRDDHPPRPYEAALPRGRSPQTVDPAGVVSWRAVVRRLPAFVALLLLPATGVMSPLSGQTDGTVRGEVRDAQSGNGILGAVLQVVDSDGEMVARSFSASEGHFTIQVPAGGPYTILAQTMGYRPATSNPFLVVASDTTRLDPMQLDPEPIIMDTLQVDRSTRPWRLVSGREAVAERQRRGQGLFIPGDLLSQQVGSGRLVDYLSQLEGLRVGKGNQGEASLMTDRGRRCLQLRVNEWDVESTAFRSLDGVPLGSIAAIEVYRSAEEVPPDLRQWAGLCGLVNVWTWSSW